MGAMSNDLSSPRRPEVANKIMKGPVWLWVPLGLAAALVGWFLPAFVLPHLETTRLGSMMLTVCLRTLGFFAGGFILTYALLGFQKRRGKL